MQTVESKFPEEFRFAINGLGGFPDKHCPRILYLACQQAGGKSVFALHKLLGKYLKDLGHAPDRRPWQAHITLARQNEPGLIDLGTKPWPEGMEFTVSTFDLMESVLLPGGPEYHVLERYRLGK